MENVSVIKASKRLPLDDSKADLNNFNQMKMFGSVKKRFLNRYLSEEAKKESCPPLCLNAHRSSLDDRHKLGSVDFPGYICDYDLSSPLILSYPPPLNIPLFHPTPFEESNQPYYKKSASQIEPKLIKQNDLEINQFAFHHLPYMWSTSSFLQSPPPLKSPSLTNQSHSQAMPMYSSSQPFSQKTLTTLPDRSQQQLTAHDLIASPEVTGCSSQFSLINTQTERTQRSPSPLMMYFQGPKYTESIIQLPPKRMNHEKQTHYQSTSNQNNQHSKSNNSPKKSIHINSLSRSLQTKDTDKILPCVASQSLQSRPQAKSQMKSQAKYQAKKKRDKNNSPTSQSILVVPSENSLLNTTTSIEQSPLLMESKTNMPLFERDDNDNVKIEPQEYGKKDKCLNNSDNQSNYQVNLKDKYCYLCERNFENGYDFKIHLKYIHNNNPKTFVCRLGCQFTATSADKFKEHCTKYHRSFEDYIKCIEFKPALGQKLKKTSK